MRGKFISLEGTEGCGKSTQAGRLAEWLRTRGHAVRTTREPGGTPTGEMIRDILQHHASGEDIAPETEVLLFAASRAQHVARIIRPALERGEWVICDRFVDSSLAYQGHARNLGLETVLAANQVALGGLWPDLTIWFDLPVGEALARVARRGHGADRFESEALAFHQKVSEGFRALTQRFPERVRRVDAAGSVDEVANRVLELTNPLAGEGA